MNEEISANPRRRSWAIAGVIFLCLIALVAIFANTPIRTYIREFLGIKDPLLTTSNLTQDMSQEGISLDVEKDKIISVIVSRQKLLHSTLKRNTPSF